ncbi:hypothetical protein QZM18_14025 [Burkholderia diffusa]|uniref:hypothetical protein n=1 Tax=Burkholderia diffusa TaxID=488732 RepID=UPI002650EA86|nr:hypothetical protein [Burkholderia diffusa]MDN7905227.1 hypothetical protein [Burkholderia diffusa]
MGRLQKYDIKPYVGSALAVFNDLYKYAESEYKKSGTPLRVEFVVKGQTERSFPIDPQNFSEFLEILRLSLGPLYFGDEPEETNKDEKSGD